MQLNIIGADDASLDDQLVACQKDTIHACENTAQPADGSGHERKRRPRSEARKASAQEPPAEPEAGEARQGEARGEPMG